MTLPVSGPISFNAINVELGVAGTTTANINQTSYRTLAGVPSGTISLSNFYGKSNTFSFTISSNTADANLRTLAIAAGWNQSAPLFATINSGVYVYSSSTGTPGLTINGSFPNGVELTNNGTIVGMGGAGGNGVLGNAQSGGGGGIALSVSSAVSIRNNATIAGGGGGGGAGGGFSDNYGETAPGAGGGGGQTGLTNSAGGSGYAGQFGSQGTVSAAGAGAPGGGSARTPPGGNGGSWGTAGTAGGNATGSQGTYYNGAGGGAAGPAISGNSFITYLATGTRIGPIT